MQAVRQVRHVTPDSLARAGLERADDPTSLYSESTGLLVLPWYKFGMRVVTPSRCSSAAVVGEQEAAGERKRSRQG